MTDDDLLRLPDVALCCIDCTDRLPWSLRAMRQSLAQVHFGDAVLLTDRVGQVGEADLPASVRRVGIEPLRSVEAYSRFMLDGLLAHLRPAQSHVLVIQWDGHVLNAQAWSDEFLGFDYIGAPWPHLPAPHDVGNGGFSLRSRRLIDALQDADIRETQPEDHVICLDYHDLLVARHGIRFAPVDVASRFAFELTPPKGPTFGFHGFFNFHLAMPDAELQAWLAGAERSVLLSMPGRRLLKNLIRAGRHESARRILDVRASGNFKQRLDTFKLRCRLALRRLR